MKTNNQNLENNNQPKKTEKPQQVNQPQTENTTEKKAVYIKDMPPIDGARPGVI
ncbi:MAG: hypothetical protein H7289_01720 [Mucilaginibacter sp.]|nr:hypothetical protein [Mucilaginibacter sp.]